MTESKFEGWAVVELYGHTKETGFVTTQYFGGSALFQIDIPELPEREVTMESPGYTDSGWTPEGSVVKKSAVPARSRLVGPGAIYSLNPCTEEFARKVLDHESRIIAVVSMAGQQRLAVTLPGEDECDLEDDDHDNRED